MPEKTLVLYDGDCGLCGRLVAFLRRRIAPRRAEWHPLQGEAAAALLAPHEGARPGPDSVRVITAAGTPRERLHLRAAALLALAPLLPWPWRALGALRLLPGPLLNLLYRVVARLRPSRCRFASRRP